MVTLLLETWIKYFPLLFFFFFNFNTLFIYFIYLFMTVLGLLVFVCGLSLVAASGGHSSSRCAGLSLSRPLPLRGTGSRRAGSVVVAHGPRCSAACGIFPDQGSNPCPLHWQADSQPLRHQGSPPLLLKLQTYLILPHVEDMVFLTNWRFVATLHQASLLVPFFQQHLLTWCLCHIFLWVLSLLTIC